MNKKTLVLVAIAAVAVYIWHNNSASPSAVQQAAASPSAVQQAALTQLQKQLDQATYAQLTTMPISTTLIAEPVA